MENYQLLIIIGANISVFLGFMGAVIALHIHGNNKADKQIHSIQEDIKSFHKAMYEETKDFHRRLCEIEAKK